MFFKTILAAATVALFAGQAVAAPAVQAKDSTNLTPAARAISIASDPVAACNCPNNCQHKNGDSCKFYSNGNTLSGECQFDSAGGLTCIA